jgi:hypothetical protein
MNGLDRLGVTVGLSGDVMRQLAEQVKENHARLRACARHDFVPKFPAAAGLGQKYVCARCRGEVDAHAFLWYSDGLAHGARAP